MLKFMFITNDPSLAKVIFAEGVERIFVDWEINGKQARQGHLDTVMSKHSFEDAVAVRAAVPEAELLIRLNPFYEGTSGEVEKAIKAGADLIMLPMFTSVEEVAKLSDMVDGRVGIVPLFETPESLQHVQAIASLPEVVEIYVGLNDLHLALHLDFMFEPLANGMLDGIAAVAKQAGLRFGFGGIARAEEGLVSGAMVLGEHVRLRSDAVIISRSFFRPSEEEDVQSVFSREIKRLREHEARCKLRSPEEEMVNSQKLQKAVAAVVALKKRQYA